LKGISWPDGTRFAFSIFDDTDRATLENVPHIYRLLRNLGFRTTKTVWPISGGAKPPAVVGGSTCDDPAYLAWVKELAAEGFEIALHNVTYHGSKRDEIEQGLDRFAEMFGHYPMSMANHTECEDGMYWGAARISGIRKHIYQLTTLRRNRRYFGHVPGSPHFWGDLCRDRIMYVRNFAASGWRRPSRNPAVVRRRAPAAPPRCGSRHLQEFVRSTYGRPHGSAHQSPRRWSR
jgi:hypothetical protein